MTYEELMENYKKSQNENKKLLEKNQKLTVENSNLKLENSDLKLENNNLKRIIYGVKREYTPALEQVVEASQCSLFDDGKKVANEELAKKIEENVEEITVEPKEKGKKRKGKKAGIRKESLKDVKVEVKEYTLNENEKCPRCGGNLIKIGTEEVRSIIEYIPAKIIITNFVQTTYKCEKCGGEDSENEEMTIVKTELPKPLLNHSFASPSLVAEVIQQKYHLGVPLYRQEKVWEDRGLILPRNMMANWVIKMSEYYLENLYELMKKTLKAECNLLHCDETTIQCNKEEGRNASSKSYMWVLASGVLEEIKGVIFKYDPSRSEKVAEKLLEGFNGILITDGYAGYNNVEVESHAECWAHARRYFYDSIPLDENNKMDMSSYGYEGLTYCNKLFEIEQEIAEMSVEEKLAKRQKESEPVFKKFYEWVYSVNQKIIVSKKLKKALTYVINQKEELGAFLTDGRIPLSNSLVERTIRPFAIHRKNWLFADSVKGANASAVMYSLIESAKLNKLNIYNYINYLLEEIPQLENPNEEQLRKYLPWSKELPEDVLNFQGTYEEENEE